MDDLFDSIMRGFLRYIVEPILEIILGPNALSKKMPSVWHYRVASLCLFVVIIYTVFKVNNS
jgi:hypothetical protein